MRFDRRQARRSRSAYRSPMTRRRTCARTSWRSRTASARDGARPAGQRRRAGSADPHSRDLRLSPGDAGPAPELRRARARGGRAAAATPVSRRTTAALDEDARVALLRRELASHRLLSSPFAQYSDGDRSELAIVRAAASAHAALRQRLHHHLHHLQVRKRLGHARGEPAAQGSGPVPAAMRRPTPPSWWCRCSRPSATWSVRRRSCGDWLALPEVRAARRAPRLPGSDGRATPIRTRTAAT